MMKPRVKYGIGPKVECGTIGPNTLSKTEGCHLTDTTKHAFIIRHYGPSSKEHYALFENSATICWENYDCTIWPVTSCKKSLFFSALVQQPNQGKVQKLLGFKKSIINCAPTYWGLAENAPFFTNESTSTQNLSNAQPRLENLAVNGVIWLLLMLLFYYLH